MTPDGGTPNGAWFEHESFWEAAAAFLFDAEAWRAAARDAEALVELLELAPGRRVLDLGCGPGRFAIPLARLGLSVTGVDLTGPYLRQAARRARDEGLDVELVQADMREFRRPRAYSAALSMLTSFGYFEEPEGDLAVLHNVLDSLEPGGRLLIDTIGKEILGRIFQARDWKRVGDEVWLFERRPVRSWSWMENTWIRVRDGGREEFELGHRLYSAVELMDLVTAAGFESTRACGALDGSPYDEKSNRLIVVARKGAETP